MARRRRHLGDCGPFSTDGLRLIFPESVSERLGLAASLAALRSRWIIEDDIKERRTLMKLSMPPILVHTGNLLESLLLDFQFFFFPHGFSFAAADIVLLLLPPVAVVAAADVITVAAVVNFFVTDEATIVFVAISGTTANTVTVRCSCGYCLCCAYCVCYGCC